MNDEECIARYDLLVKTIVDEAKAKKQEELVLANEECEDERRKILESGQRKMDLEYEKKEKQVELAIKMYAHSVTFHMNFLHELFEVSNLTCKMNPSFKN